MKKFVTVIFALAMILALTVSAAAATGINANEQAVLDKLSTSAVIGDNGWSFSIPASYVNSAKNYFLGDCDMTEAERDVILSCIDQGMALIKADGNAQDFSGATFSLHYLRNAAREQILTLGIKACAEVDLKLTYTPASNTVTITPMAGGAPVFESTAVIKTTGQFAMNSQAIAATVAAVLVLGTAVVALVAKKNGLLVK